MGGLEEWGEEYGGRRTGEKKLRRKRDFHNKIQGTFLGNKV